MMSTTASNEFDPILDKFSTYASIEKLKQDVLFHATSEKIVGDLRGGGYDGVFWTARTADIAQTYIAASGISTRLFRPQAWEENTKIRLLGRKDDVRISILRRMGYELEFKYSDSGDVFSFSSNKTLPTHKEIWDFLSSDLGYKSGDDSLKIKLGLLEDGSYSCLEADYKPDGQLFVLFGAAELNLINISNGEGDLTDLQYNKLELFKHYESKGFDGVIIDDFAQTEEWGNVGHESVGLFASGLQKISHLNIKATNHDWEKGADIGSGKTAEFDLEALYDEATQSYFLNNHENNSADHEVNIRQGNNTVK